MRWLLGLLLLLGSQVSLLAPANAAVTPITIPGGPTSATEPVPVSLEADLYLPDQTPAPAVIVAHGFGGSKASVAQDATYLVERGFAVLTYSARGFGASSGQISMNSPEFEVADASRIIDYLADLDGIVQDAPGDPRVGIAGGSYGGALALLAAGYDPRVDAVAADITWNNLERSLFGQSVIGSKSVGVYKELWAGLFFSSGLEQTSGEVNTCGRFTPAWCTAYSEAASRGVVEPESRELMWASSPVSITDRITAPTLLGGGQSDSLFPLSETDANAEQIRTAHPEVPVKVVWHAGGHDGGISETDRLQSLTADWFNAYLRDGSPVPLTFEVSTVERSAFSDRAAGEVSVYSAPEYPGVFATTPLTIKLETETQQILAPAGGVPAAVSSLPGLGALSGAAGAFLNFPLPNQSALFTSQPLDASTSIVGSPRVRLSVSSDTPRSDVTLFVNLRILGGTGIPEVPKGLVAPVRLNSIGPQPTTVEVALPT
ncbi:MAG: hypothetical protein RJB01_1045, partial [Actinomycetota bacterium]